jgi:alkylmercury lyase-like protein
VNVAAAAKPHERSELIMDFDSSVKLAIYRHFASRGRAPSLQEVAAEVNSDANTVRVAYGRLRTQRVLFLEPDGESIRMAPPFSGVPTQHRVLAGGQEYIANCAWDALGILAALRKPGTVVSACAQSGEPLRLQVGLDGPEPSDWIFHCLVQASQWWKDLVFT